MIVFTVLYFILTFLVLVMMFGMGKQLKRSLLNRVALVGVVSIVLMALRMSAVLNFQVYTLFGIGCSAIFLAMAYFLNQRGNDHNSTVVSAIIGLTCIFFWPHVCVFYTYIMLSEKELQELNENEAD